MPSDPRFARLKTDPRFKKPQRNASKIEIDPRFKSVFDEKPSKRSVKVDKYGRKLATSHEKDALRKFYKIQDDEELPVDYARGEGLVESSDDEETSEDDDGSDVFLGREVSKPISVLEREAEIDLDESQFAALDAEAENNAQNASNEASGTTTKPTTRLAVVNLDWDHVKSSHLFKAFSSLISYTAAPSADKMDANSSIRAQGSRGRLLSVRVYPSEFGKKKMAEEDKSGPPTDLFKSKNTASTNTLHEINKGEEYNQDSLRRYQLERLRYYYAIAIFDSVKAASHVYNELDGTEFERSANLFDLSYVPEDMEFDEAFRDETTSDVTSYQPINFATDALRHSNVKLTWDDDDPERTRITKRSLSRKEIEEMDFKAFIASSSEDEDASEDGDTKEMERQKLRDLLLSGNDENLPEGWGGTRHDKAEGMEVTFMPSLIGSLETSAKKDKEETTLERYKRKEKEKKKAKKEMRQKARTEPDEATKDTFFEGASDSDEEDDALSGTHIDKENTLAATEAELALLVDPSSSAKHFDMSQIVKAEKQAEKASKKGKKRKNVVVEASDDFEINIDDPRFKHIHDDHNFAIDPSNPQFKKTKNMKTLLTAGAQRRRDGQEVKRRKLGS